MKKMMKSLVIVSLILALVMGMTMMSTANGEGGLVEIVNETGDQYFEGDMICLHAKVTDASATSFQWQLLTEEGWKDIDKACDEYYCFYVTEENAMNEYRVLAVVED